MQDASCPDGTLEEPVARYQPLPSGGLLHDHCLEPLIDPSLILTIDREGRIQTFDFVQGSGCLFADEQLRRCLMHWVFTPAMCDDEPIDVERGLSVGWDERRPPPVQADPCRPLEEDGSPM